MRALRSLRNIETAVLALALATATPAGAAESGDAVPVDLLGTWFVLVHYKDSGTANPDAERWEDKVWSFTERGTRLEWTEYPLVVFENTTGRFETLGRNSRSRTLRFWEPNESQRAQIQEGPRVNSRGIKKKTLRGNSTKGYESFGQLRAMSAAVIGYHETWTIDSPSVLPMFTRDDMMGTGRSSKTGAGSENLEGRTRYTVTEVADGGDTLSGTFVRDESRIGTFRLIRAGAVQGLPTDDKTPNEKAFDRAVDAEIRRKVGDDEQAVEEAKEAVEEMRKQQRDDR